MKLTDLKFSKHIVEHEPDSGLAELADLPALTDYDPTDGFPGSQSVAPIVDPFAGNDTQNVDMPAPPPLDSRHIHSQYLELLWMALLRDVPFGQHNTDVMMQEAKVELGKWGMDDPFRPKSVIDGGGAYMSRLLLGSVPDGDPVMRVTRYCSDFQGQAYGTNVEEACAIQSGRYPTELPPSTTNELPLSHSGRTLASVVRADYPLKFCVQASLLLAEMGVPSQGPGDDPDRAAFAAPFVHWAIPHLHDVMGRALRLSLMGAWKNKYTHMYPRPELWGIALEHRRRGHVAWQDAGFLEELLHTQAVRLTIDKYGSATLPLCYAEGSPAHPSYPAGHSLVAGMCATILKLWFRNVDWPGDMRKDAPSVHHELNKMALNVATGRSWAGVHWRDDNVEGLFLGERMALDLYSELVHDGVNTGRQQSAEIVLLNGERQTLYFEG